MFACNAGRLQRIGDLGMPPDVAALLSELMSATSGAILVTGPAGSGKTTTVYACLREVVAASQCRRSIVSLEDPIEMSVAGVAQSQIEPSAGFTYASGLRSLMRQDPEIIMVGEIRDRETAEVAFQAALTGQLLLTTFHAGTAAGAIGRLLDMGIEPYILRSGIVAIVAQRLLRKLCSCALPHDDASVQPQDERQRLGLPVVRYRIPVGCEACAGTGYRDRVLLAEILQPLDSRLIEAILLRRDIQTLQRCAVAAGMIPLWRRACDAVESGGTSPAEIHRVFGPSGVVGQEQV
jgi:type II secretory ATPase GspE/PulE/Tfp pilus assembly ATPase PilB-like protein